MSARNGRQAARSTSRRTLRTSAPAIAPLRPFYAVGCLCADMQTAGRQVDQVDQAGAELQLLEVGP